MHRSGWLFSLLAAAVHPAPVSAGCAEGVAGLRALLAQPSLPLRWTEIGMDDGRPLLLTITERDGALHLSFVKSGQGLWAEGGTRVCRRGAGIEARLDARDIRLGPAAHWALRFTMANGADFLLTPIGDSVLEVQASGWSGRFTTRP